MRILIVEDDPELMRLLAKVLDKDGHELTLATTGSGALAISMTQEFDMLITDLMLPDLQGTELIRALKAQAPMLPVIVISALDADDWLEACIGAGASLYLQKPLSIKELRREIQTAERSRIQLAIAIIEDDGFHSKQLANALTAAGATTTVFKRCDDFSEGFEKGNYKETQLVLFDGTIAAHSDFALWAKKNKLVSFAFAEDGQHMDEENLMRCGVAFFTQKPVNIEQMLIQAQFISTGNTSL